MLHTSTKIHELRQDGHELRPKHFGAVMNKNIAQQVDIKYYGSKRSLKMDLCSISFMSLSLKLEYPFTVATYLQFARNVQLKVLSTRR
jgi:hypothetical protein